MKIRTFNTQEYTELFNAFEHVCDALEFIKFLYIHPLMNELEENPENITAEMILAVLKEMETFIDKSNLSYSEFIRVVKLLGKEADQKQ